MKERFFDDITEFIFMEDEPCASDLIMIPGSTSKETVYRAAQLFHEGYAPYVLPSGRFSKTAGKFPLQGFETEWEFMRSILVDRGVPGDRILREDQATYTWENAIFSRKVVERMGLKAERAIICCQAFHARRAYTYYRQQFTETELIMSPVITQEISRDNWFLDRKKAAVVLGELQRCGDQFRCMIPPGDPIGWP